jgi:hypothetical protein
VPGHVAASRRCGAARASRRGSVADTGGVAVLLPCRGAGTGEARGRAGDASGAAQRRQKRRSATVTAPYHEAERAARGGVLRGTARGGRES